MTAVRVLGYLPLFNDSSDIYPKCEKASLITFDEFSFNNET